jgi:hypothetical protein
MIQILTLPSPNPIYQTTTNIDMRRISAIEVCDKFLKHVTCKSSVEVIYLPTDLTTNSKMFKTLCYLKKIQEQNKKNKINFCSR